MARINTKKSAAEKKLTHGGAVAAQHVKPLDQLKRSVLACFLWEDNFYEDGIEIAKRIEAEAERVKPEELAALAITARNEYHLRHVPLLLLSVLCKTASGRADGLIRKTIPQVVKRADELAELLAIYWRNGRTPLSGQLKKGLAAAFGNFDAEHLAKYNRDHAIKLRDVLFLTHATPSQDNAAAYRDLASNTLASPDTWEVELSAGKDKCETFTRLLKEGKLGYLALLRNLRNMIEAKVEHKLIKDAILARKGAHNVLPFRFIAAAIHAPKFEAELDAAMMMTAKKILPGKTVIIIDVSGSMSGRMSGKSQMERLDVAAALGAIARGMCEEVAIYLTAGSDAHRTHKTKLIPARSGMAMVEAVKNGLSTMGHGGIFLTQATDYVREKETDAARTIVITDEQDCSSPDSPPAKAQPLGRGYMVNVANNRNGIGYGPKWTHLDGLSENLLRYIAEIETVPTQ